MTRIRRVVGTASFALLVLAGVGAASSAAAQFQMILDIEPGISPSSPDELIEYDGVVYFAATDSTNGREFWVTGGKPLSTFLVADINAGGSSSNPTGFTEFDGLLYFAADDGGTFGRELWKSSGALGTTELAADIDPSGSSSPEDFLVSGDYLFFTAETATTGREVFRYDGTNPPVAIDVIVGAAGSSPDIKFSHDGILYFTATSATFGEELYLYDTSNNSFGLVNINTGADGSSPDWFATDGMNVFFAATRTAEGRELWSSDGTAGGTGLVANINSGAADSNPTGLTAFNGEIYFAALSGNLGRELWKSDGTSGGTSLVANITNGNNKGSDPVNLTALNGILYFGATVSTPHAHEPWVYNGTTVYSVGKIGQGNLGSQPTDFTLVNGMVYFTADDHSSFGREIYVTTGAENSAALAQDINPGTASSNPYSLIAVAEQTGLYFAANDGTHGFEPWRDNETILAVDLNSFTAVADSPYSNVVISWETGAEIDNIGFHIFRANADGSIGERLTSELIAAEGNETQGATYTFTDPVILNGPGDARSYYLVDVDINGVDTWHGPAAARINPGRGSAVSDWMKYF